MRGNRDGQRGTGEKGGIRSFRKNLKIRILFFDGGTGSLLQAAGLGAGELPETWNISHPETVGEIHRDYLNAGCRHGKDEYLWSQPSEI